MMASESPRAFVLACIQKQTNGVVWMGDLCEEYPSRCRKQTLRPFPSKEFMKIAEEEVEVGVRKEAIAEMGLLELAAPIMRQRERGREPGVKRSLESCS